jgi:HSP20 family protein
MSTIVRYQPLLGHLDGLFDQFLRPAYPGNGAAETAPIRIDVRESAAAYVVHAELPGVKKDDISIEIEGNEVQIGAESKRDSQAKDGEKVLRTERFFGKSSRRFSLPVEIDETKVEAKFADGVLELTLPKKAAAAGRKITIQ